ncbi:hypothetical protein FHX81_7947 [Saccharothrix saharensis]|uniref:Uncharacterized protein n=1 Tax=Saccharothrix saharensis TaxID=571190 RepID=A0A543JRT7_9PSEU|nr:hypothetical protein FHX81_7947 [Saccharothrix saharensis]
MGNTVRTEAAMPYVHLVFRAWLGATRKVDRVFDVTDGRMTCNRAGRRDGSRSHILRLSPETGHRVLCHEGEVLTIADADFMRVRQPSVKCRRSWL